MENMRGEAEEKDGEWAVGREVGGERYGESKIGKTKVKGGGLGGRGRRNRPRWKPRGWERCEGKNVEEREDRKGGEGISEKGSAEGE